MQAPKGFENWSDKCRKGFAKLNKEWNAREAAARRAAAAAVAVTAVEAERDKLSAEDAVEFAALDKDAPWLAGYADSRKARKAERKVREERRDLDLAALGRTLHERFVGGELTEAEAREEYQEAKEAADAEVDGLARAFKALKRERDERLARRADLEKAREAGQRLLESLERGAKGARRKAKHARAALDGMRSEKAIIEDYLALLRKCGSQELEDGEPVVTVLVGGEGVAKDEGADGERTRWDEALWQYLLALPQEAVDANPPPVAYRRRAKGS